MYSTRVTSYLALLIFLQIVTGAFSIRCTYTTFSQTYPYTCLSSQYCCGRNQCCYTNDYYYGVYDLWYFWFCLCFGIFICSLASGAYYRKRQLREMQVAAVRHHPPRTAEGTLRALQQNQGAIGGLPDGYILHSGGMVTTTVSSGHPMYPQQSYFGDAPPGYSVSTNMAGPIYPTYPYMQQAPPPTYNSCVPGPMGAPFMQLAQTNATLPANSSSSPSTQDTSASPPSTSSTANTELNAPNPASA